MSREEMKHILNSVLLALQLCLGIWQFTKFTPVGGLIQGVIGGLFKSPGLIQGVIGRLFKSPTYSSLKHCRGRVFKRANCFTLQADIPFERRGTVGTVGTVRDEVSTIDLHYLDSVSRLERRGRDSNMLFINNKMCYYITPSIWEELQRLQQALSYGLVGPPFARSDAAQTAAAARSARAARAAAVACDRIDAACARAAKRAVHIGLAVRAASAADTARTIAYARAAAAQARAEADSERAAAAVIPDTLFVKGNKGFWAGIMTGGVMTLEEVLDDVILNNQHVSGCLNNYWLLPVNLSASEEKVVKILNLVALFLQTEKAAKVNWLIPTALSFISALMEFSTDLRVWIYTKINLFFCGIMHFICDPLPRSWRRHVYSLGKWVDNLAPCNDIELKVVRGTVTAIITEGAKVDKEGAILVPWLEMVGTRKSDKKNDIPVPWLDMLDEEDTANYGVIEKQFRCDSIVITCGFVIEHHVCEISAPGITNVFYVKCRNENDFRRIITFVQCIAQNRCGSLVSCGANKRVKVRGFEESVTSYGNSGLPPVYKLDLENVVVA